MPQQPYYRIDARGPAAADIYLNGPIGEDWFEESVTASQFVRDLEQVQAKRINLFINSPGGSVMDANVIHAALRRHPATVTVTVDGWALSAASLVAMAGDSIRMGQRSLMMLHNPSTFASGDASGLRKTAEVLDKIKSGMVQTYAARMQSAPDAVSAILDRETWYTAAEAVSAGLADEVVDDTESFAPAAPPESISNLFNFIPAAYAAFFGDTAMARKSPRAEAPDTQPDTTESAAESEMEVAQVPPSADSVLSVQPDPDPEPQASDIEAKVQAGIRAERERTRAIRAAFAPWVKRGYTLDAVQAECEDGGLSIEQTNAKILAALGAMAEPLAAGQGAPVAADSASIQRKLFAQVAGKA